MPVLLEQAKTPSRRLRRSGWIAFGGLLPLLVISLAIPFARPVKLDLGGDQLWIETRFWSEELAIAADVQGGFFKNGLHFQRSMCLALDLRTKVEVTLFYVRIHRFLYIIERSRAVQPSFP